MKRCDNIWHFYSTSYSFSNQLFGWVSFYFILDILHRVILTAPKLKPCSKIGKRSQTLLVQILLSHCFDSKTWIGERKTRHNQVNEPFLTYWESWLYVSNRTPNRSSHCWLVWLVFLYPSKMDRSSGLVTGMGYHLLLLITHRGSITHTFFKSVYFRVILMLLNHLLVSGARK